MNYLSNRTKPLSTFLLLAALLSISSPSVYSQTPAQKPLLNSTGGGVAPNFMVTMDDSGSMSFRHIPELVFDGGSYSTTNPVGSNTVRWDPSDSYQYTPSVRPAGTVPGNINSTSFALRALRSPDTNTIYYNPEVQYKPWYTGATGLVRRANSNPTAAMLDPLLPAGASVNLTAYTVPGGSGVWCHYNTNVATPAGTFVVGASYSITFAGTTGFKAVHGAADNNVGTNFTAATIGIGTGTARLINDCQTISNNAAGLSHDPGVYFRLQKQTYPANGLTKGTKYTIKTTGNTDFTLLGAANSAPGTEFIANNNNTGIGTGDVTGYSAVGAFSNYTGYSINMGTSATTFVKGVNRKDCLASSFCTRVEERQNFANWFSYYRNRNLLARGAMMESFADVGNTLRLGFGRINKGVAIVDNVSTAVIESDTSKYGGGGVRAFDQTRKNQFFKWLEDLPAGGGTPLPAALDAIGQYYSRTDNQGPYTDNPGPNGNTVSQNVSCRRSYQLMVTDGYWNGTPPSVGNQDADAGVFIPGGSFAYAANTPPFADSYSDTLADIAMKYWKNDIQPAIPGVPGSGIANNIKPTTNDPSYWQNMTNYMVGLGVRGDFDPATDLPALSAAVGAPGKKVWGQPSVNDSLPANIDDLWHAALNSRGEYYSAQDPASLATAVASALRGPLSNLGLTAGVATVSSVLENGNRKYVPSYDPSNWSGDIAAQPLNTNGVASVSVWSAEARLPPHANSTAVPPVSSPGPRNIYTWASTSSGSPTPPSAVPFLWGSLNSTSQTALTATTATGNDLVNFLRGDHSLEGSLAQTAQPYRLRIDGNGKPFRLGDFVNSNPVLIRGLFNGGYSQLSTGGGSYNTFIAAKASRAPVLFVGSNDGMLHAFKDINSVPLPAAQTAASPTDGQEVFAFVPRTVYPNLADLSSKSYGGPLVPHRFFVDGPQREADAYINAPGASTPSWRNYLLGSLGAGGKAIYALDVTTSPTLNASNIRWEFSSVDDADLGYVLAPIQVGVLPGGRWVAIFGNGVSSTNGYATLFVVDLQTAAIVQKLTVDTGGANGLGGVAIVRNTVGEIETLYAGDLNGKLWRFDYNTYLVPFAVNGGVPFFSTGTAQPITQPPSIFDHSKGGKIIVFGTGKLVATADATTTDPQSIYGVWDKPGDLILPTSFPRPLDGSKLATRQFTAVVVSSTLTYYTLNSVPPGTAIDWNNQRGWKVDLSNILTGGRVIYPTQPISSNLVLVTAVQPAQNSNVCTGSDGIGADFVFDVEEGVQAKFRLFDTNGDGKIDTRDDYAAGVLTKALGIRAIVTGLAGNNCLNGGTLVSVQNSLGQQLLCLPPQVTTGGTRRFDRVQRRIINPPIR